MITREREKLHWILLDLVLQGGELDSLVATLAGFINFPVLVLDAELNLLACSDEKLRDHTGVVATRLLEEGLLAGDERTFVLEETDEERNIDCFLQPIKVHGNVYGYLCVIGEEERISSLDTSLVKQAAQIMALDFQKRLAVEEIERRYLNDFVRDLLEGRIESRASALHRGNIYKWDLTKPQVLFAIKLVTSAGHGVLHPSIEGKMLYLHKLEKVIRNVMLTNCKEKYLVAHLGDVNVMLLIPDSDTPSAAKRESLQVAGYLIPQLQRGLDNQNMVVKIGISRVCYDFMELPAAFHDALEAIQMNVEMDSSSMVVHYDDLGITRLLMRLTDTEEMERYCEEHLGELIRYDEAHGTTLLKTLSAVIETNGHLKEAANKLFIHYNTLRYRLQRIREIAGIEFSSWREVTRVEVAIEVFRILQARKKVASK